MVLTRTDRRNRRRWQDGRCARQDRPTGMCRAGVADAPLADPEPPCPELPCAERMTAELSVPAGSTRAGSQRKRPVRPVPRAGENPGCSARTAAGPGPPRTGHDAHDRWSRSPAARRGAQTFPSPGVLLTGVIRASGRYRSCGRKPRRAEPVTATGPGSTARSRPGPRPGSPGPPWPRRR